MALTPDIALALWRRALDSEIGIAIEVTPEQKESAVLMLYNARKDSHQLALDTLTMVKPGPKPNELWICKKATEL